MFREYCPERGCLAVEFSPAGDMVHAYPYRLDELVDVWEKIIDLPRGTAHPFQSPEIFQIPHCESGGIPTATCWWSSVTGTALLERVG